MHFLSPGWLVLLVAVALLLVAYVAVQLRRRKYVARFSNLELLGSVAPRRPGWRRHLTFALLLIGLAVLSVGVARPSAAVKVPRDRATVMLDIDVSLSMEATDVLPSRLQAAQKAAKQFSGLLPARINLGLISFARNANVLVPPTVDREAVKKAIDGLQLANYTAIGEAIFSSLDAIHVFSQASTAKGDKPPPARIVLLSDGSNTFGRPVSDAVAAAKKAHVQVSTIAFGTPNGTVQGDNGEQVPVPADDSALSQIAHDTGGTFHTATSVQELESVYKDIGSQIGYTTQHRDISWRFLTVGFIVTLVAAGLSMLWSTRFI
jgi:Ca-activated chloride channel family protein